MENRFDLTGSWALITGGSGLLGPEHGIALAKNGSSIVLIDLSIEKLKEAKKYISETVGNCNIEIFVTDITVESELLRLKSKLIKKNIAINILVNNASINPKMDEFDSEITGRVEDYNMDIWEQEIKVGITGTFLCCKIFGTEMASRRKGVIINIASDLAILAPDQRVYSKTNRIEDVKHFKPIGYPVVKSAMLGLNRYLATYWAHKGVRVNCLIPASVYNNQPENLVLQISNRVPLQRLSEKHEFQEALAFLASDASSYMTGQVLILDGGRSIW